MKVKGIDLEVVMGDISSIGADYVVSQIDVKSIKDEYAIRLVCRESLKEANKKKATAVAFPALGCEGTAFPVAGSAKIMSQEVLRFLKQEKCHLQKIIFCVNDEKSYQKFHRTVSGYVTHIQDTLGDGPYVTVDIIIEMEKGIILIERSNPPYGWALPGGFVDCGESLEETAIREAKEETNCDLENLRQMHTYSKPDRDPRFHTISTVFIANGKGTPQFGDDAKGLKIVPYDELTSLQYAFDHNQVIEDYLLQRAG